MSEKVEINIVVEVVKLTSKYDIEAYYIDNNYQGQKIFKIVTPLFDIIAIVDEEGRVIYLDN